MQDKNTLTRIQLSEAVYREIGLSKSESSDLVQAVLDQVIEALLRRETVKLTAFGSFSLLWRGPSLGRNPQTGKEVAVPPRYMVSFRPSHILRRHVDIHADAQQNSRPGAGKGE